MKKFLSLFKRMDIPNLESGEFNRIRREEKKAVVVDVRSRKEFSKRRIPGAVNIDIHDRAFLDKLKKFDRDSHFLLYCQSGQRSMIACRVMHTNGYEHTYNLRGGIVKWPFDVE